MGNRNRLNAEQAAWLEATMRRNRERFAGWKMEADPAPSPEPAPSAPPPADPPSDPKAEDGKGGKDAILADLAKERDKRQQAEAQQQATLDAIAKALGLKADDAPPDPTALAEKVTTSELRAQDAERKLAVFMAASQHDANATALLDSTSFMASVTAIDPTDSAAVAAAIEAAVKANPAFKATPPTPPFPGGPRKPAGAPDPGPGLPRLRDAYAQSSK